MRRVSYAAGVAIVATAFVLLAACQQPTTTPAVSTTKWASDGNGNLEFITNDSANYGYGYWETFSSENITPATTWSGSVAATLEKVSGGSTVAFGMVFCYQTNGDFYFVNIAANGGYYVGQDIGGTTSAITTDKGSGWIQSTAIKQGDNVANVISVAFASPTFTVSINGNSVCTFGTSATTKGYTTGTAGFKMSIGTASDESFPGTPEKVLFKMNSPQSYP